MSELDPTFLDDQTAVADEYVLGILSTNERVAVQAAMAHDPVLRAELERAETQFASLSDEFEPVTPHSRVKKQLFNRLFSSGQTSFWKSLPIWRSLAAASMVLAIAVLTVTGLISDRADTAPNMVASIESENSDVHYIALYEATEGTLKLRAVSGSHGKNKSFELWLIEGSSAPESLGILPTSLAGDENAVTIEIADFVEVGDPDATLTFAISLEPLGGSTTGAPTGPVVAAGQALEI